ncbi:MAG TPA: hypothetical protein HA362_06200 [Nanoarchaeota archaeon]|nr:hypothetical protein [Nanoarchaeota archaeon]
MAGLNWKIMEDGSSRFYALKQDLFAWAKENGLAEPDAKEPDDYLYIVTCSIQDHASQACFIDLGASKGERIVYYPLPPGCLNEMSTLTAEGLARIVLGLK